MNEARQCQLEFIFIVLGNTRLVGVLCSTNINMSDRVCCYSQANLTPRNPKPQIKKKILIFIFVVLTFCRSLTFFLTKVSLEIRKSPFS